MKYCRRCVLPNTKPGLVFDSEGICSACRAVERKHTIDWAKRERRLRKLCEDVKGTNGSGYECIVPVSGGKDSTYQAYVMSKIYGLRVLCVNITAHLQTEEGIRNLNSLVESMNLDLIKINVRPSTQKRLRRYALFELGNPNYAEHQVVFAGVARAALNTGAPLVVWGEDIGQEFGGNVSASAEDGSAEDLINNDLFMNQDFGDFTSGRIDENELYFYKHPAKEEFSKRSIKSIYLSHFLWWDGYKHYEIAKSLGFMERRDGPLSGNLIAYDNIDEKLCELHIWFKFLKFGFWRPTDQACYHIWNGRMTRTEAVQLVREKQYEFPGEYLAEFLEYHQMTLDEFRHQEDRWRNPDIWERRGGEWRLIHELT